MKKQLIVLALFVLSLNASSQDLIKAGASVKQLADGMNFTEGPIADAKGDVFFSDIPPRRIMKWSDTKGLSIFKDDVPGCNGMFFDTDSNLIVAGNGEGRNVWKLNIKSGAVSSVVSERYGVKYNGPNDVWIDKKGGIYFTDPVYGKRAADVELQPKQSVYYIVPGGEEVLELISDFVKPNGIIATPNGKTLYAADINDKKVYAYKINKDGTLKNKTLFANEPCDGMTLDEKGNIYFTNSAVQVYNNKGEKILEIEVPERPTNVCFGGSDRKTLYITARKSLYAIQMNVKGVY